VDARKHLFERLHDRFAARLPDGNLVSVGDVGLDREIVDEQERGFAEAARSIEQAFRERAALYQGFLTSARKSFEYGAQEIDRLRGEITATSEELRVVDREVPIAEQALRNASAVREAAMQKARVRAANWPDLHGVRDMSGQVLTRDQAIEYVAACDTHHERERAGDASRALYLLRDRQGKLSKRLVELIHERLLREEEQPGRRKELDVWELAVAEGEIEAVQRMARAAIPRERPHVPGAALRAAKVARVITQAIMQLTPQGTK
jgi:hypothetical protein